jgi:hypothetical protein
MTIQTKLDFSVTLLLGKNQQEVTLTAEDFTNFKKGVHFALPADVQVDLGTMSEFLEWFNEQLKSASIDFNIPTQAGEEWPQVLRDLFNGILNTDIQVQKFSIDMDPSEAGQSADLEFNLAVTGTPVDEVTKEPKPMKLGPLFSIKTGGVGIRRVKEAEQV